MHLNYEVEEKVKDEEDITSLDLTKSNFGQRSHSLFLLDTSYMIHYILTTL